MVKFVEVSKQFDARLSSGRSDQAGPQALYDIDFVLEPKRRVGLVGESGCGKTTLARLLVGLITPSRGSIYYDGKDVRRLSRQDWKKIHNHYRMIFQNARNTFDPGQTVGDTLVECFRHHRQLSRIKALKALGHFLPMLGLNPELLRAYPNQASLGQLKRFSILRALSGDTKAIIADEPTAGLDRINSDRILTLLRLLHDAQDVALLIISHDISMVLSHVEKLYVLYRGRMVEVLAIGALKEPHPMHPYTLLLLESARLLSNKYHIKEIFPFKSDLDQARGCIFVDRCHLYRELNLPDNCLHQQPQLRNIEDDHWTACHYYDKIS